MDKIYHEKQEGMMCAQHSLNNLLQSKYFTEFDLATIANQIDQQEREKMAEGGMESEDYRRFLKAGSKNMDDSGYFSIEVIIKALKVWNLDIVRYNSKHDIALKAQNDPTTQNAYILNFKQHWLTIRKIGQQYFNLNSLLSSPQLLSTSYLHLFLAQLLNEGYSIFIVVGELPRCEADEILKDKLIEQTHQTNQTGPLKLKIKKSKDNEDDSLNQAIQESLLQSNEDDDKNLNLAISLSLGECNQSTTVASTSRQTPEEIQDLENLEKAIRMSMEN